MYNKKIEIDPAVKSIYDKFVANLKPKSKNHKATVKKVNQEETVNNNHQNSNNINDLSINNNHQNSNNINDLSINNNHQNSNNINDLPLNPHNSLTVIDDNKVTLNQDNLKVLDINQQLPDTQILNEDNPKPDIEVALNEDNLKNKYKFHIGQQCTYKNQDYEVIELWTDRVIAIKSQNLDNPITEYLFIGEDDDITTDSVDENISTEKDNKNNYTNEESNNLTSGNETEENNNLISGNETDENDNLISGNDSKANHNLIIDNETEINNNLIIDNETEINNNLIIDNKSEEIKEAVINFQGDKIIIDESYQLINTDKELIEACDRLNHEKVLGIDTETTGLDAHIHKLRLIQIASYNHPTIIIDCYKCNPKLIQPLLINDSIKIFHNAKFDLKFFLAIGLEINQKIFDTMLAYQLINAGKYNLKSSLKEVAKELLNIDLNKEEQSSQWVNKELTKSQLKYSAIDAKILLLLREKLREEIVTANLIKVAKIEFDCVKAVAMMEFNGMLLDLAQWQNILEDTQKRKYELEIELKELLSLSSENKLNNDYENKLNNNYENKLDNNYENKLDNNYENKLDNNYENKSDDKLDNKSDNKLNNKSDDNLDNKSDDNLDNKSDNKLNNKSDNKLDNKSDNKLDNKSDNNLDNKSDDKLSNKSDNKLNNKSEQLTLISNEFDFKKEINLDSPKQILEALNKIGIPCQNTNSKTLKKLLTDYPILNPFLEYKKLTKILSSFGDSLTKKINPITGRLHGSYNQLRAETGRFTSSNPNLQNLPRNKETRSCYIASPSYKLIIADYSQIELRIAAEITNDKTMIEAYNKGEDLHKLTASIVLNKPLEAITKEDRQIAKSANFGLIYGASVNGFRGYAESNYGISLSEKEAKTIMDNFFKSYQGLAKWHKKTKSKIYNQGINETRTLSNRRRFFDNASPQQILNTPIQGTGADILKSALANLITALKPYGDKVKLLATVHDEIILEAHEEIASEIAKILSDTMVLSGKEFLKKVPIEADSSIGNNWSDK
jgi:DNA polymerase I-like protein with 3'-5' exonuclease and polymerase domains